MIQYEAVSQTYPGGTRAVDEVSLQVSSRSTCVLLGSSGSGKTTLLRMVNRMVEPTRGRVLVDGRDVRDLDAVRLRRSIGYVLQAGGLLPHRTVLDNIATVPVLEGARRADARRRSHQLLEVVGLDTSVASRYPAQLSGGQQQRVGVARALANDPDILLMDEPFGAVDPIVRRELQAELRRLQAELDKTILLVTHDVDEAFALADQVVLLRPGGTIAQQGTPADFLTHPADDFVEQFVGLGDQSRNLRVAQHDGVELILDGAGRVLGRLAP